jgi:DNA-binding ferritin-like protein (Dps family)
MSQDVEFYANAFRLAYLVAAGDFKTTHEVDGRKVVVTRGPGGQFASPGGGGSVDGSDHPLDFVTATQARRLESFAFGEEAQKLAVAAASTFNLPVRLPAFKPELPFKDKLSAALDGIKDDVDKIKDNLSDPDKIAKLTGLAVGKAIPASLFLARTIAPDVLLGLALGESIPLVLGSAIFYAALSSASSRILKYEGLEDNLAAQAVTGLATLFFTGGVVKSVAQSVAASKFGTTGIHQIVEAGKTADDLKATFQAVDKHIKSFVKPGAEKIERQRERFLSALSQTAERVQGTSKGPFFQSLSEMAGHLLSPPSLAKDLQSHVEKKLNLPSLEAALTEVGVDAKKLSDRLAEMCNLDAVPRILHKQRAKEVKQFVQRVHELPGAIKAASQETDEYAALVNETFERAQEIYKMPRELLQSREAQKKLEELTLSLDKINTVEYGAKWRADLIKAEIEKGDLLDSFLHARASGKTGEDLASRYEGLLGALVKDKPKKLKTRIISDEELLKETGHFQWAAESWGTPEIRASVLQESQKTVDLFSKMSPVKVDVELTAYGSRPYSLSKLGKPSTVNLGTGGAPTIFHELTHVVEENLDKGLEMASAFRGERTQLQPLLDELSSLGMPGEKAIFDAFINRYSGKIYPGTLAGEIYTTAMQEVATSQGLYNLAVQDREHLMFTLSQFLK